MTEQRSEPRLRRSQLAKQELYRRLVVESAERLFAEKGFDDTKVDEIAREAELAPGTLYSVFPGKAAILDAIQERHEAEIFSRGTTQKLGPGGPPLEHVAAMVRVAIDHYIRHPDILRINLSSREPWSAEPSRPRNARPWERAIGLYSAAFQRGIEDGSIRPGNPRAYARATQAVIHSQLSQWVEDGMPDERSRVADETVALVIGAVRA